MIRNTQILGNKAKPTRQAGHCGREKRSRSPLLTWATLATTIALGAGLTACGQKGPLYLPAPVNAAPNPSSSPSK